MSYGQPCRSTTAGPSAGPASAYPILRTPAVTCFSGPKEAVEPGRSLPPAGAGGAAPLAVDGEVEHAVDRPARTTPAAPEPTILLKLRLSIIRGPFPG